MQRKIFGIVLLAAFMMLSLASISSSDSSKYEFTASDIVGKYELPLLLGGTVEFDGNGICTLVLNPPPNSTKGPLVIKEIYVVKGDIIHFKQVEVGGRTVVNGEESQQQIVSVTEGGIVLKELPINKTRMHKRIE
jgi:hypothetical protein